MTAIVSAASAEHYIWGEVCDGWRLIAAEGLSVIEEQMPPGAAEQRHLHRRSRLFFYVLEGELTMEVEGCTHRIAARQGIEVAPGESHQAINRADAAVRFLVVSAPPAQNDRVPG